MRRHAAYQWWLAPTCCAYRCTACDCTVAWLSSPNHGEVSYPLLLVFVRAAEFTMCKFSLVAQNLRVAAQMYWRVDRVVVFACSTGVRDGLYRRNNHFTCPYLIHLVH